MDTLSLLAQAVPTSQPTTAAVRPMWVSLLESPLPLMAAILVLMWFFVFRTKRKDEKKRQAMLDGLKKGDRIQTIGGVLGTVVEARATDVVVKVDETNNTKIRFARSAIHRVVEGTDVAEMPAK